MAETKEEQIQNKLQKAMEQSDVSFNSVLQEESVSSDFDEWFKKLDIKDKIQLFNTYLEHFDSSQQS